MAQILLAFVLHGGAGYLQQRLFGQQSLKYLMSGPLQKMFADSCPEFKSIDSGGTQVFKIS